MDWTLWAGFVLASLIVGLLPGPGVTSIVGLQAAVLLVTFSVVVTISDGFYAVTAGWVAGKLKGPGVRLWSQHVGGAVLIAAGLLTVATV